MGVFLRMGHQWTLSSLFESLNCTATVVSKYNMGLFVINWVFLRILV